MKYVMSLDRCWKVAGHRDVQTGVIFKRSAQTLDQSQKGPPQREQKNERRIHDKNSLQQYDIQFKKTSNADNLIQA